MGCGHLQSMVRTRAASVRPALALLVAAVMGVGSLAGSAPAATAAAAAPAAKLPSHDSFYRYTGKTALKKIKRGTVLKKRQVTIHLNGDATPFTGEQLLYRTENERRKPAVTVTTVIQPPTAAVRPQIVAYLSFYDALGPECDPSYTLAGGYAGTSSNEQQANEEEAIIASYLSEGST